MDGKRLMIVRGELLQVFIGIELTINKIISHSYLKRFDKRFLLEVLYNPNFSFALRKSILEQIARTAQFPLSSQMKKDLHRLADIRNLFAHCGIELVTTRADIKDGSNRRYPDPKDPDNSLDLDALFDDFKRRSPGVQQWLNDLATHIGEKSRAG